MKCLSTRFLHITGFILSVRRLAINFFEHVSVVVNVLLFRTLELVVGVNVQNECRNHAQFH